MLIKVGMNVALYPFSADNGTFTSLAGKGKKLLYPCFTANGRRTDLCGLEAFEVIRMIRRIPTRLPEFSLPERMWNAAQLSYSAEYVCFVYALDPLVFTSV